MRDYEGLFLLKPDFEKEELNQMYEKITDTIKRHEGEVTGTIDEWGKKRLAYKIGKYSDGIYCLLRFKIKPSQIAPLNADFKLNESIIRTMLTQS